MTDPSRGGRLLPVAGIVGPAAFIAAWVVAGTLTAGYSWTDDAISRLAAVGAPDRLLMTAGFVGFGVAVPLYAIVLRRYLAGPAWVAAATTGAATLGVALFPLGTSTAVDGAHNAMAVSGYLALAAIPLLAARPLVEAHHRTAAVGSRVVAGLAGASLAASLVGPSHGLYQRAGLTLVDVWLMASALVIIGPYPRGSATDGQAQRSARS